MADLPLFCIAYGLLLASIPLAYLRARRNAFIASPLFLLTPEWRTLRTFALRYYGKRCMHCGKSPPEIVLNVDHVKPRKTHPHLALKLSNLQPLCQAANKAKGNQIIDYRKGFYGR